MARVALIKLFSGLNISTAQLAGVLQSRGHECATVYVKRYLSRPVEQMGSYGVSRFAGILVGQQARQECWNTFEPLTEVEKDLLLGFLKDYRADLVGFSLTSSSISDAEELTALIRDKLSIPVIWGGPGPTLEPEQYVHHPGLLCVGEGEDALLEVAQAIEDGSYDFANIKNIWAVENGTVVRNDPRPLITDLDQLAFPTIDPKDNYFINDNRLISNLYPPNLRNVYPIMASRGCPFACKYCINHVYRRMFEGYARVRSRSVSHVIEELLVATRKYDLKRIMFYDDVFAINKEWADEFAHQYKSAIGLPFWCYTDPRATRKENLAVLKDAGLDSVTMGIQSGSQRILDEVYDRHTPRDQILRAAHVIQDLGLGCACDLMTFVAGETEDDCRETFELLVDLPKEMFMLGFGKLTYYPGYDITSSKGDTEHSAMTPELYDYYHRLYQLTRTNLPRSVVRFLGASRSIRRFPRLLDLFIPKHRRIPGFFVDSLDV
jgi:radical SAM superfamily enzyme YgiQ (UPF0313 family)